jgi:hypothetical protein
MSDTLSPAERFEAVLLADRPDLSALILARQLLATFPHLYREPLGLPARTDALPGPAKVRTLAERRRGGTCKLWHPDDPVTLDFVRRKASRGRNGAVEFGDTEIDRPPVPAAEPLLSLEDCRRLARIQAVAERRTGAPARIAA